MPEFSKNYIGYLLSKCSLTIGSSFYTTLKKHGVTISTWRILAVINDKPLTVNKLADMVLLGQSTLSKTLDRLEKEQLLVRKRDSQHRRKVQIHITKKGEQLINKLIPLAQQHEDEKFQHMSVSDKNKLKQLLQELIEYHSPQETNND